jgi:hypothetical protein
MLHAHVTSWGLTFILFAVVLLLHNLGKTKGAKITHMNLRLFLLLTAGTGIGMVFKYSNFTPSLILKALLSLYLLFLIEIILVRTKKGTLKSHFWFQLLAVVTIVLYLGFMVLPFSFMG